VTLATLLEAHMTELWVAVGIALVALLASIVSVEFGVSIAIVEIVLGVAAANFFGLETAPWVDFVAAFGSIVLTFLAGAEVDTALLRAEFKGSLLVGGVSFLAPFVAALLFTHYAAGWSWKAAEIAGVALSTTSLAVVYAVLVETGLNLQRIGKLLMSATFVTDFGTALVLSLLFIKPTGWIVVFVVVSALMIWLLPKISPWFFRRYGDRVIEPEIKLVFFLLFLLMALGKLSASHAVLPAFLLGLAASRLYTEHDLERQRLRVVAFAFLTPIFFIRSGMNVSLAALGANLGLLAALFGVKLVAKIGSVLPLARGFVGRDSVFFTLLMSTGLTFGTISSLYGYQAGIIDKAQFSLLVTVVVASAVIPTLIAQRWFRPRAEEREDG
jgi:Kef-type K+ transport system membrane component KefB